MTYKEEHQMLNEIVINIWTKFTKITYNDDLNSEFFWSDDLIKPLLNRIDFLDNEK